MNCHMCGQREATVHLLEVVNSQKKSLWLCNICASGRANQAGSEQFDGVFEPGEPASLANLLGQVFESEVPLPPVTACPRCHYEFKQFQESNRLGCAGCYHHFRQQVLPLLSGFHRHTNHLGKVPQQAAGRFSQRGEITRIRVALEKAIQKEDYEHAAELRDKMRRLLTGGVDSGEGLDEVSGAGGENT